MLTIAALSDTHGGHEEAIVPEADVLVHAGDFLTVGVLDDAVRFGKWLARQPHRYKVVIAGNHDAAFQHQPEEARAALGDAIYLQDSAVTIEGFRFYGSPWTPKFLSWSFMLPRGPELAAKWAQIPDETDVLITHGPPRGILDRIYSGRHEGCDFLAARIREVRPQLHFFGHIHESAGETMLGETRHANVTYLPGDAAAVFTLEKPRRG
ncbi:MAG TPA: metallophosphatase domain-containing protein [Planctomycetia bacterium]|nr:metallophosphatase domain-containing protein [Planctomycetia bacterium]